MVYSDTKLQMENRHELYDMMPCIFYEYIYANSVTHTVSCTSCIMGYVEKKLNDNNIEDIDLLLDLFDPKMAVLTCSQGLLLATQGIKGLEHREIFLKRTLEHCTNVLGTIEAESRLSLFL